MKKTAFTLLLACMLVMTGTLQAQVTIGSTDVTDASAVVELKSTDKGFLPPRLTTAQRNAIVNPAVGLMIYNTTSKCLEYNTGTGQWKNMCNGAVTGLPVVSTTAISAITTISATSGGNVTNQLDSPITERGVCWDTSPNPTIANNKTSDGSGLGSFTSSITGLTPAITYYVRAFATNGSGTSYGEQTSFNTSLPYPMLGTTTSASSITVTNAITGGNIISEGGGALTAKGVCWSTSPNPTIADSKTVDGTTTGAFSSTVAGLFGQTTYYVRSYATNIYGTAYGDQISFTTQTPSYKWFTNTTSNTAVAGSQVDGLSNTKGLLTYGYSISFSTSLPPSISGYTSIMMPVGAVEYCMRMNYDALGALKSGITLSNMWYLPSKVEMNNLWISRSCLVNAISTSSAYWTSTEYDSSQVWRNSFITGEATVISKTTLYNVRCVHK